MAETNSKKYFHGISLSVLSMGVSLGINLITYPLFLKTLPEKEFIAWFSTFEISQLFLLLDIGFTQGFIRNCSGSNINHIKSEFAVLRGSLRIMALLAFLVQMPIYCFTSGVAEIESIIPYALLAASVTVTIASYSETAALRVLLDFKSIYIANIAASIVFGLVIYLAKEFGVIAIAAGCLIRSMVQSVMQKVMLPPRIQVSPIYIFKFDATGTTLLMNSSYFFIFAFDSVLFNKFGILPRDISTYMIHRKLFDVFRGVNDAILNVIAVRLASSVSTKILAMGIGGTILGAIISFIFVPVAFKFLFGQSVLQISLTLILTCVACCTSLFRFAQIWCFMARIPKVIIKLFLFVILAKFAAAVSLFLYTSIVMFYCVQILFFVPILIWSYRLIVSRTIAANIFSSDVSCKRGVKE